MALKPSPIQVALIDELIEGATSAAKYDEIEKEELNKFRAQLQRQQSP